MKITIKSFFYLLLFIPATSLTQWNDSFDDADFNTNPVWLGDTSHFKVNSALQLQLNAPAQNGRSYLSTPSVISCGSWSFRIRLDFNPSSGNYAKVYLTSDRANIDTCLYGYFLRIGGTDDDISLFRQDGLKTSLVINGEDGLLNHSVSNIAITVSRDKENNWKVFCDTTGTSLFFEIGSGNDSVYQYSRYFGIQCIYSSTRADKFFFDDFKVDGQNTNDTTPPSVRNYEALNDSTVVIEFSEPVDAENLKISPESDVQVTDRRSVAILSQEKILCRGPFEIVLTGICDMAGNRMADTTILVSYCPGEENDVLITEIMADPDPPVLLPDLEYIELLNRSGVSLNLGKWTLQAGEEQISFPDLILPADSFLLVCPPEGCDLFGAGILCVDRLPLNALNNSGEYIGLRNRNGELIHWVNYDPSYYHDELKNSGGWSMEMTDTENPCAGKENWKACTGYRGGSPRRPNSVKGTIIETGVFQYLHIYLPADSIIRVWFSKPLKAESIGNSCFQLEGQGAPVSVTADSMRHQYVDLIYSRSFQANTLYSLQLSSSIAGCSGAMLNESPVISFMKPAVPVAGDIVINEIMFDALPGRQEFVEFYNSSNKYISSEGLKLAYHGPAGTYTSVFPFCDEPFLIAPQSFAVLVRDAEGTDHYYLPDMRTLSINKNLPAFHSAEGCIRLMNKSMEVLDQFCYSEKMHYSALGNKSGVSLERVRYGAPTSDPENWHSASSTSGYATPGEVNSQFLDEADTEKEITLEYEIFSPDNDGYKDIETIYYKLDKPGFAATILIFDAMGRKVRTIANNQTLGTEGFFTWDGIDDEGHLAGTGIYLVFIEMHHSSGEVKRYKMTCVVGAGGR